MFFNIWSINHAGYVFSRFGSSIDLWCEMVWLQSGITIPHFMKRCTQCNFFIFIFIFCVLLRHGNISFMFFNIWSINHAGYVFSRFGSSIDLWCEMVWLQSGITIPHFMKRCTQCNFFIFIFIFCVLLRHGNISFMFFNTWSISHAGWVFSWWRCSIDLWYEMVWFQAGVTSPIFWKGVLNTTFSFYILCH